MRGNDVPTEPECQHFRRLGSVAQKTLENCLAAFSDLRREGPPSFPSRT